MSDPTASPPQPDFAFYKRLFDGAGLAVFAIDLDARVLACNPLGQGLFARRGVDPGRDGFRGVLPEQDRPVFDERLQSVRSSREPAEFRTRLGETNDDAIEYAVWFTPVLDDDGELQSICVWFHDITIRLQLRRGMKKRERLTQLGVLAGSVAHHYNNLLCSIATSLDFALNMNTMSAMRRVLRRTADAAGRATQLTQQLLAFAQADHRMCDLADLTETVLKYYDDHEPELAERGIKLDLDWERIPFVPLPREQLIVVIENLTQNAVEAMPDGGLLTVTLRRRDENSAVLAISDTGPGIPPGVMDRVFEPFFTTRGELGAGVTHQAGMGLAVAHGLVSEMHGTISAVNTPSGGARFEIVMPTDSES